MNITFLHIKNYKNIADLEVDLSNSSNIIGFTGINGSGKSNILEAISWIFAKEYDPATILPDKFKYLIRYEIDNKKIEINALGKKTKYRSGEISSRRNNQVFSLTNDDLPDRVIACYSGEEQRLWENIYEPFYNNFKRNLLKSKKLHDYKFIYINKYYWAIALLAFLYAEYNETNPLENSKLEDFRRDYFAINQIKTLKMTFDIPKSYEDNFVVKCAKKWREIETWEGDLLSSFFTEFKAEAENSSISPNLLNFFTTLATAHMPKEEKIITNIECLFDNNNTIASMSEGEKKLLLVCCILRHLSTKKTLVLLDEPDSHIHTTRKKDLVQLFYSGDSKPQTILTTHSPTLVHQLNTDDIIMLQRGADGNISQVSVENRKVIQELTSGYLSVHEQNLLLNENKDIILVEGITDEMHINTALEKLKTLKPEYQMLDFVFVILGGANGLKSFVGKFKPKEGQMIFAFLDRDSAGYNAIKSVYKLPDSPSDFKGVLLENVHIYPLPLKDQSKTGNFSIEDYYDYDTLREYQKSLGENFAGITSFDKKKFAEQMKQEQSSDKFVGFSALFDLIIQIKQNPNITPAAENEKIVV